MTKLTEDEEKTVESMAQSMREADQAADARRQYAAYKPMVDAQRAVCICPRCGTGTMSHIDGGRYGQSYIACANCGARQ